MWHSFCNIFSLFFELFAWFGSSVPDVTSQHHLIHLIVDTLMQIRLCVCFPCINTCVKHFWSNSNNNVLLYFSVVNPLLDWLTDIFSPPIMSLTTLINVNHPTILWRIEKGKKTQTGREKGTGGIKRGKIL